jgi:hypothetical protein
MTTFKRPQFPIQGGCPCGSIRYELTAMPLAVYACHCTECQKRSGSAFALNMPVQRKDYRITKGEPKAWRSRSPSGGMTTARFCGDCGGRIHGERDGRPEVVTLRAGTLDDTGWVQPVAHMFMRSAQAWETIASGVACYETEPADFRSEVGSAWHALIKGSQS